MNRLLRITLQIALGFGLMLLATGCAEKATDRYAHIRAFLQFRPVSASAPLLSAVSNQGMFCTIRIGTSQFLFTGPTGASSSWPITDVVRNYGQPECVAGFVVGIASTPDLNGQMPLLAYDLACPNCYAGDAMITKELTLSGERLSCSRCHRIYDLQSDGIVVSGDPGQPLLRYRSVVYNQANDLLVIMN